MQLDVLSVLQLPPGPGHYSLQEQVEEHVTVQVRLQRRTPPVVTLTLPPCLQEFLKQRRRRLTCLPRCGLLSCVHHARYAAGEADGRGVEFAFLRNGEKPSAWVLQADDDCTPSLVRVEAVKGEP